MRRVALVVIGDGRVEYLKRSVASLRERVDFPFCARIMVDDSGDAVCARDLDVSYPDFRHVHHPRRRGAAQAVRSGWRAALRTGARYLFHAEQDFSYDETVKIDAMADILDAHLIAQVALKRDPYSPEEHEAGGFMELTPDGYVDRDGWCEHELFFTLNPSLIPRHVFRHAFTSEAEFAARLVRDGYRFAYWGAKLDQPRVTHIGLERSSEWRP